MIVTRSQRTFLPLTKFTRAASVKEAPVVPPHVVSVRPIPHFSVIPFS